MGGTRNAATRRCWCSARRALGEWRVPLLRTRALISGIFDGRAAPESLSRLCRRAQTCRSAPTRQAFVAAGLQACGHSCGLRLQDTDLDQHAREVEDATFVNDLPILQAIHEYAGGIEATTRRRYVEEVARVRPGCLP